jgi:hypothetical protein
MSRTDLTASLNFVDTLTFAAILDFLIYYYNLYYPLYLGVESHVTPRFPMSKREKFWDRG